MRGLRVYIAVGLIVLLGLAALAVWIPRQVSVLIEARSEIVTFAHGVNQEPLVFRFADATVCDDSKIESTPSTACPDFRALEGKQSGALEVYGPARMRIMRRGQGAMRVTVTPDTDDNFGQQAQPPAVVFRPDQALRRGRRRVEFIQPVELRGLVTIVVPSDAPPAWFAADSVRQLQIGAVVPEAAEAGAPALIEGELLLRGRSVYRVLIDRWRDSVPQLADNRFLLELGSKRLRRSEAVELCANSDCDDNESAAGPEAVLRVTSDPAGGLAVVARALAAAIESNAAGARARVIKPSLFDRLHDPLIGWAGALIALISSFSLFVHQVRGVVAGVLGSAMDRLLRVVGIRGRNVDE